MRVSRYSAKGSGYTFWAVVATLLLSTSVAYSQVVTATLVGTVKDPTGAVVPKAQVVAKDDATGVTHQTTSDSTGGYRIPELQPGTYTVTASFQGFKQTVLTGVILEVNLQSRVDITLTPGAVEQKITVAGRAPLINTENAMVGQVIGESRILEMPLNGRNFMALTTLTGGISEGNGSNAKSYFGQGYAPSAAGEDATENNYELDGADNRESFFHGYNYEPPLDSIQEFNIQVGQYTAEFGAGGGAVINVVTKSGSNHLHGSLYEFLRNTDLNGRNFFSTTIPPYHQNQFGISVGGPIKKDKAFFFLNYEGYRQLSGTAATAYVPTQADRQGNLADLGKTIINPATRTAFPNAVVTPVNAVSAGILAYYPLPNVANATSASAYNFVSAPVTKDFYDNYLGRFDYALSTKNSLTARYGFQKIDYYSPGTYPLVGGQHRPQGWQNGEMSLTTVFTPTLVNVARFGYNRTKNFTYGQNTGDPIAYNLGITLFGGQGPFYAGFPESVGLSTTKMSSISEGQPWYLAGDTFQYYDSLAWTHGNHSVKAGVNVEKLQIGQQYATHSNGDPTFNGQYTGDGFADFLLGEPATYLGAIAPNAAARFRDMYLNLYLLDDWKVTPKLTLNIGLRYEYYAPPYEENGLTAIFDPSLGNGAGGPLYPEQNKNINGNASAAAFFNTYRPDLSYGFLNRNTAWLPVKHNFAPRFGFAYRPTDSASLVIRGGYGWYYSTPQLENIVENATAMPPATQWPTLVGNLAVPNLTWNGPVGVSPSTFFQTADFGMLTSPEQTILTAYTQQYSLGVEHQMKGNVAITVEYLGSKTTHAIQSWDYNFTSPSAATLQPRLPYPEWGRIFGFASGANLNYNSLIASAQKRVGHGLSFVAAYTYGHELASQGANYTGGDTGELQNPLDRNSAYEPGIDDMTHRFTISYIYQLPFGTGKAFGHNLAGPADKLVSGWDFAGVTTAETGFPVNPSIPSNNCNDSAYPDLCLANRVGNWNAGGDGVNTPKWNVKGFTWPSQVSPLVPALGNAAPLLMRTNGLQNWDFALTKNTSFLERYSFQFRAEFFNGFNHPNFGTPNATLTSSLFGRTTSTQGNPRLVQFGLKFLY